MKFLKRILRDGFTIPILNITWTTDKDGKTKVDEVSSAGGLIKWFKTPKRCKTCGCEKFHERDNFWICSYCLSRVKK